MRINHRMYRSAEDDPRIRELLSRHYAATRHPYYAADPPNWERISAALRLDLGGPGIHLWELAQPPYMLAGLLLLQKPQGEFSCLVHPEVREIEDAIYDRVEQSSTTRLRCSVCEGNEVQKSVLAQRGYAKGNLTTVFRKRSLDGALPEMVLLEGYRIQEVQALSEGLLAGRALAESEVFGDAITAEYLRELQRAPIYRPELDLVIAAPDGRIAAFCTAWFDGHHKVGFYEPIGTVPAHRQRGLGKALMLEGFRRLSGMGATTATLGHRAGNRAGSRLYESVGMAVFDQEYWWEKQV